MNCPNCNIPLSEGAAFCTKCGAQVEPQPALFCFKCGAQLAGNAAFCTKCGTAQGEQPGPAKKRRLSKGALAGIIVGAVLLTVGGVAAGLVFGLGIFSAPAQVEAGSHAGRGESSPQQTAAPAEDGPEFAAAAQESPQPEVDITGNWEYWGYLGGWEDEAYIYSPIPEEELNIDRQGEPALSIMRSEAGVYIMNYYGTLLQLYEDEYGFYDTLDDGYGYFVPVDANTLHQETRGDITVYKRAEGALNFGDFAQVTNPDATPQEAASLLNGRVLPYVNTRYYSQQEILQNIAPLTAMGYTTSEALRIARNECYANYGNVFKDEALNYYFYELMGGWFEPYPGMTADMVHQLFNQYELANIETIQQLEELYG